MLYNFYNFRKHKISQTKHADKMQPQEVKFNSLDKTHKKQTKNISEYGNLYRKSAKTHHRSFKQLSTSFIAQNQTNPSRKHQISVYLMYKKHKIVVKIRQGTEYKKLIQVLYEEILNFQLMSKEKSINQAEKVMNSILGFKTVNKDLHRDYLLSIMQGKVQNTIFLQCFCKKNKKKHRKNTLSSEKFNFNQKASTTAEDRFNYQIYSCLAIGGFSKVYLGRSYEDGKFYVLKFIKKRQEPSNHASIKNEIELCSSLDHPFIVKLYSAFETSKLYCLVFEYCPGGELFYMLKKIVIMSENQARFYFIQALLAFKYIHQQNILYRDLKPENILLDCKGNLKIVDFGLSKKCQSNKSKSFSYCGSAQYMAPQMILRLGHDQTVDFYSLGALLYELVTGLPPFYKNNPKQLQNSIICQELSFPSHTPLSAEIRDLLTRLLEKQSKNRIGSYAGIREIIYHPWVGKFNQRDFLDNQSNKQIPFPTNLEDCNFDKEELGDDETEFSQLVHGQFEGASGSIRKIKCLYRREINQKDKNYYEIKKKALENASQTRKVQKNKSLNRQMSLLLNRNSSNPYDKAFNTSIRSNKPQDNSLSFYNTKSDNKLKYALNYIETACTSQQKKYKKQNQLRQRSSRLKNTAKILPYFFKVKPHKLDAGHHEIHEKLPRSSFKRPRLMQKL